MKIGMLQNVDRIQPMLINDRPEELSIVMNASREFEEAANNYINSFDSEKTPEEIAEFKQIMDDALQTLQNILGPYINELQQQESPQQESPQQESPQQESPQQESPQ